MALLPNGHGIGGYYIARANAETRKYELEAQGNTVELEPNHTYTGQTADGASVRRGQQVWAVSVRNPRERAGWPDGPEDGGQTSGPQAMAAVQAGLPQPTGGGQGFQIGASTVGLDIQGRPDEYKGIDTFTPDNRLSGNYSPRAVNWDSFRRMGSKSTRSGMGRLSDDRDTVHDGSTATLTVTCVAKASFTADTDYILFRKADGTTHAFWFDVTGSDTEPAGSDSADASTQVNISSDTTAIQVAARLETAINTAAIGLAADDSAADGTLTVEAAADGHEWRAFEYVTNAGFTITDFTLTGSAISSDYRGLSILPLPASGGVADKLLLVFKDKDADLGEDTTGEQPTALIVVDTGPRWGRPHSLYNRPGPSVVLSDQGSQVLRVTADYFNLFPLAQRQLMLQSVVAISILIVGPVAGAQPRHPLDPDGVAAGDADDGTGSFYAVDSTGAINRRAWRGAPATNYDIDLSALGAGKYWISVFGFSRDGISEATKRSITLA